jgi:hypothetical protein
MTTETLSTEKDSRKTKGSEDSGVLLEKYIRFKYPGNSLEIHRDGLIVKDYDFIGLWNKVENIFNSSVYKDKVIIGDITGGTKMMSVALAMACIPPKRLMQYMDADRDWRGEPVPTGNIVPVLIDIDPILYPEQ